MAASKLEALYGKAGQDVKKRELLVSVEAAMLVKQHKNTLQDIEVCFLLQWRRFQPFLLTQFFI